MKAAVLTFFAFLFTVSTYACTCSYGTTLSRVKGFENVFTAKVVEVLETHKNSSRAKKIRVEILENFNQKLTSNIVWLSTSKTCPVPNPTINSTWLFYISEAEDGKLSIPACNPSISLQDKRGAEELQKVRIVKNLLETHDETSILKNVSELNSAFFQANFSRSKKYAFDDDYGLYVIQYEKGAETIKHIETLKGLGSSLDAKVVNYYKKEFNIQRYNSYKSKLKDADFKLSILVWKVQD
ncbi:hypothetical protein [Oceanihabitans sediminis]|uniref:hypothetical protein n=1 Tax=Oceanihabitans sediminis TaxID=1812012 RepID=UPI0009302597|nr:hypothetical protein [Oceanihabitans sediminis]MDX1774735.1 hypothetical protein [Oceanihabitans sediminis]